MRNLSIGAIAMLARLLLVAGLASVAGCAILPRNAVPPELVGAAVIPGMPDVRAVAGRPSAAITDDLVRSFAQESPADFPVGRDGPSAMRTSRCRAEGPTAPSGPAS